MSDTCRNCRRPIVWGAPALGGRAAWWHTTASLGDERVCVGIDWPDGEPWPVAEPDGPAPDSLTAREALHRAAMWGSLARGCDDADAEARRLIDAYREELTIQLAEQIIADAEGVHGGAADGRHAAAELIDPREQQ